MTIVKKVFSGEKFNFGYGLLTKPMLKILYEDLLLEAKSTESDFNKLIKEKEELQLRFNILADNETKLAIALKHQGKQLGDKIEELEKSNEIMADDTLKLLNTISEKDEKIKREKLTFKFEKVGDTVFSSGTMSPALAESMSAALKKLLA